MNTDSLDWSTWHSLHPGPRLIVTGAVHGIETCGMTAILRLREAFASGQRQLRRGRLTLVPVCNPLALRLGRREGESDLNRRIRVHRAPETNEQRIANVLAPLLLEHDLLLDLHSFQSPGQAFAVIGPDAPFEAAAQETELARHVGVERCVEGGPIATARPALPEEGASTCKFMRAHGRPGITVECGQHDDAEAPEIAYRAIENTLAWLGLIEAPPPPPRQPLALRFAETILRRAEGDHFTRPWQSFDAVRAGEPVGEFADGETLRAPRDGYLVFPDPLAAPGAEWLYFADATPRFAR